MLNRLHPIFRRYADRTLTLELGAQDLPLGGRLDRAALVDGRLVVAGRVMAQRVGLTLNGAEHWIAPEQGLFMLDVPFAFGPAQLRIEHAGGLLCHALPVLSEARLRRARQGLIPWFGLALVGLAPEIWRWKMRGDMGAREVVKERLRLVPPSGAIEMQGRAFTAQDASARAPAPPFTIVMPVYNAHELLAQALDRVVRHTQADWCLILIEDASTDPRVRPFLRDWAADHGDRVTLLCNETNLGFIGSVNRGLSAALAHSERPVVLLNSDALVPDGWAARLLAPLADPSVASVTPMSNDAEIFTVPALCHRHDLTPGEADAIDRVAARLDPVQSAADAPTGVGFCMAIAPQFLRLVPTFDTAFGRGYGEETDWCQKVRAKGGRHLGTPALFVEHRGGQSFGSAEKQRLLERNAGEISRRYPVYDGQVQTFLATDPLVAPRLALGLALASLRQGGAVPVYLAHAMGGGAETWLQGQIRDALARNSSAVVLRVGQGHRWQIALHSPQGGARGLTNDTSLIRHLIEYLPHRRIIYSCGVGACDPIALPRHLLELSGRGPDPVPGGPHPIEILFHDFFPISPSYTLLGADHVYRGVPLGDGALAKDRAHSVPGGGTLSDWQAAWGALLAESETLTVFSDASRMIVEKAYPGTADRLRVVPHCPTDGVLRISRTGKPGPLVIGVLGNIGTHKGAGVVQQLTRDLSAVKGARLVIIGDLAPEWSLPALGVVHGAYKLRDLPGLVARYGITCWFIPSIWPETFSFTTHEALATGMPVFAFDLGAQGDAVRSAVNGHALPLRLAGTETLVQEISTR